VDKATQGIEYAIVTGSSGLLGRALVRRLANAGTMVLAIDREAGTNQHAQANLFCSIAEVRDSRALSCAIAQLTERERGKAVMFHLAGISHAGMCRRDPLGAIAVNVMGSANAVEACRQLGIPALIFPSTGLVYGQPKDLPVDETASTPAPSVYAATKLAAETVLKGYAAEYNLSCSVARLGNVFGHGSSSDTIVSILLEQALKGGPLSARTLTPVRDFIFKEDVVDGLISLASSGYERGYHVYNLSSGIGTSIRDLALLICKLAGLPPLLHETPIKQEVDPTILILSIDRVSSYIGWTPCWTLESGLKQTLQELRDEKE